MRYALDLYGRWYPVIHIFAVALLFCVSIVLLLIDVYSESSHVLSVLFRDTVPPPPEVIIRLSTVLVAGVIASFLWGYKDARDRFLWAEMARVELDAALYFAADALKGNSQVPDAENLSSLRFPGDASSSFQSHSDRYIFLNFRVFSLMKAMFVEVSVSADRQMTRSASDTSRRSERLAAGLLCGVVATRILGVDRTRHKDLVTVLLPIVERSELHLAKYCLSFKTTYLS